MLQCILLALHGLCLEHPCCIVKSDFLHYPFVGAFLLFARRIMLILARQTEFWPYGTLFLDRFAQLALLIGLGERLREHCTVVLVLRTQLVSPRLPDALAEYRRSDLVDVEVLTVQNRWNRWQAVKVTDIPDVILPRWKGWHLPRLRVGRASGCRYYRTWSIGSFEWFNLIFSTLLLISCGIG